MQVSPGKVRAVLFFVLVLLTASCGPVSSNSPSAARITKDDIDAAEPAIASSADGKVFIAFVEHRPDKSADLFLKKLDSELKPMGDATRVNPNLGEVKAWAGDPPTIAVDADGTIYVGWNRKNNASRGNDLVLSVSRDGGVSFEEPVKVNDDTAPASHGMHSLVVGKDGRVYIAWLDERNVKIEEHNASAGHDEMAEPNSEIFFAFSGDGGKTFSPNQKIAADVCPCCKTSMALSPDGALYLSWRQVLKGDLRHIAVASSTDAGKTFSNPVIVSDDQWQISACPVSGAALLAGENMKLQVMWYTAGRAGQPGVYLAESDDGGKSFGPRKLISGEGASGLPWIGTETQVFQAADKKIMVRHSGRPDISFVGESPAVALINGKDYVAFVQNNGARRSVWITKN